MGVRMMDLISGNLDTLRYEPTAKRVRVCLGGEPVADTCEARLVWEPRRVVPTYAVPIAGLSAQLVPAGAESGDDERSRRPRHRTQASACRRISSRPILDPTVPFGAHSCPGTAFDVIAGEETGAAAAFQPDDPDLADYVILEFDAFEWREEDEPWSATRTTRSAASMCCAAAATSASSTTGGCSPSRRDPCCCSRRCCRCGSICLVRTSPSGSSPATR